MTVFFHGSFGLNRQFMSGIVHRALERPGLSDAELAKPFEYGAPFATKYRYWLNKTGIASLGRPLELTEMGRVVCQHDPGFDTTITKWFMHHELTTDPERAEAWHFFMCEFRPNNESFTRDSLQQALMMKMQHHDEVHFGPKSRMNPVIVRKLIECYTNQRALGELGILITDDGRNFRFSSRRVRGPWKTPSQLARAYTASAA